MGSRNFEKTKGGMTSFFVLDLNKKIYPTTLCACAGVV